MDGLTKMLSLVLLCGWIAAGSYTFCIYTNSCDKIGCA
jgi:hypothetical protein